MKCFVTGANGFIGSRLVEKLAEKGYEVNCLVRSPDKFAALQRENTHPVYGDLNNSEALLLGSKDCDVVYHLAGYAKPWSKDANLPYQINVQGTINLLEACLKNKVKRFIFTSSAAVFGPSAENHIIDEQVIRDTPFFNDYESTKAMAEDSALEFIKRGLPVVIVNPTRVYGPGTLSASNSMTKIIKMYQNGLWRILPGNGTKIGNYVYIDDVIEGHLLAAEKGISGEHYILGGENLTFNGFFQTLAEITGKQRILIHFPIGLMLFLAKIMEFQTQLTGIPPTITPPWVKKYLNHWNLSSAKAVSQLGYKITSLTDGVRSTVSWINNKG
ncbi:MAG TPA: SDR family oxidoreductase [Prolixibacteraceae bacterium]|nr:SDR family oxidoreductase [Prolixibacteraceae bacterium]